MSAKNNDSMQIDICIATYRRPQMLTKLLHTLSVELTVPANVVLGIIVADNDAELSAKSITDDIAGNSRVPISYIFEPVKNIAKVRNKAIDASQADYVAFIDDDEWPIKLWLVYLFNTVLQYKADVVFGPVFPVFPENCPNWIKTGGFFNRKRYQTGTKIRTNGTGNVLIKKSFIDNNGSRFDERYGRTGGSDTHFFLALDKCGAVQIWCDEAEVYEDVIENRTRIPWLLKRSYRGGQVAGRLLLSTLNTAGRLNWGIKRVIYITISLVLLPLTIFFGRPAFVKTMQKIAANIGHVTALTGRYYEEYGVNR